ncbi:hypothetical protein IQ249_07730 [Lusitaniella coriacea LEGE 07157]|uniref:Uncharacterized protein n=1 Tax=Lusitaniella coriacea LEGE 07157 TaxID=945747 RepID=A0A8J7DVF1_9CYAN|nr:hypothetical protein [Lusitaniella coriacea]MBE9115779.1 hypothetical protein [Lusitaniella coriacea LEGE 07157]
MASIDDLLTQLQSEYAQNSTPSDAPTDDLDRSLREVSTAFEGKNTQSDMELSGKFRDCAMSQSKDTHSPIDDLLTEVSSEFVETQSPQSAKAQPLDEQLSGIQSELSAKAKTQQSTTEKTEDLLAEVKSEFEQKQPAQKARHSPNTPSSSANSDELLADIQSEFTRKKEVQRTITAQRHKVSVRTDDFLGELKSEFKKQDVEAQLREQEKQIRQKRIAEEKRQRRRKLLKKKAEEWLKNLDIQSEEGLWFEEFAYSYSSRLEAAIDYLEALT